MFAVFLKVSLGINVGLWLIVSLAVLSALINWLSGMWDSKSGFYKIQNSYQNKELNPFFEDMSNKIDEIHKEIKK